MADTTRTKSIVHLVPFERGVSGLVDGITTLSEAGQLKLIMKPLGKSASHFCIPLVRFSRSI